MVRSACSSPITIFATFTVLAIPCVLSGCGGAKGGSGTTQQTPTITTNPAVTAKTLYATDSATYTLDTYTANQSGAVSVVEALSLGTNVTPEGVAVDASGNLYVGIDTNTGGEVLVFASGATSPSKTITLPNPGNPNSNQIQSMTIDSLGNLYVAGSTAAGTSGVTSSVASIFVYAPGATGTTAPLRTISGAATSLVPGPAGFGIEELAMDSKDNLYVAQGGSVNVGTVVMFPTGANGNIAPTLITSSTYSPTGVALDAQDNIYISQGSVDGPTTTGGIPKYPASIFVFAKGSVAGAAPTRTITGTGTNMEPSLYSVRVDSAGNIFVEQDNDGHSQFLVYSASANGNVAPSSTLTPSRGTSIDSQFVLK